MRVFVDTNVIVAALATRGLCADLMRTLLSTHSVVVTEQVLDEVARALRRKLGIGKSLVDEVLAVLGEQEVVPAVRRPSGVRLSDPDDEPILAAAVAASVDALVTGDTDLLDVADRSPIPIVTPRRLWELLRRPH